VEFFYRFPELLKLWCQPLNRLADVKRRAFKLHVASQGTTSVLTDDKSLHLRQFLRNLMTYSIFLDSEILLIVNLNTYNLSTDNNSGWTFSAFRKSTSGEKKTWNFFNKVLNSILLNIKISHFCYQFA
jgi:hypothetical protein